MLNIIKKQFKLRKEEIVLAGIIECVTFILGMIILALLVRFDDTTDTVFELGSIFAFSSTIFTTFIMIFATFGVSFNNAICMGRTRKSFVTSYTVVTLCVTCAIILIAFMFSIIEKSLYTFLYPDHIFGYVAVNHITPFIVVTVILIEVIVPMFIGTILAKYGMKAFWILWAIWMFGCIVLPKMVGRMIGNSYEHDNSALGEIERKLVSTFGSISIVGWYAIGGAILFLMLVTTINLTRKQGVKI